MRWQSFLGDGVSSIEVTPVEPLVQRLSQNIYTGFPIPRIFAKILLYVEAIQVTMFSLITDIESFLLSMILLHLAWPS